MVGTKKHLGQHFLHDRNTIQKILNTVELAPSDRILEIGPGPGSLTIPLNQNGFSFQVVEIDPDMVSHLKSQTFDPPVEIIQGDFLKLDVAPLFREPVKILSNLPYNVSVPITARLLEFSNVIPMMVLMYQKEVAMRIQAIPNTKDYGPISALVQFFYEVDFYFDVAPGAFRPPPKVTSRVIRLIRRNESMIPIEAIPQAQKLLNILFSQRRKMVRSILKNKNHKQRLNWFLERDLGHVRPENLDPACLAAWILDEKEITHGKKQP